MRKSQKKIQDVTITFVDGYHANGHGENYAFNGFNSRKYFTSDRTIALDENFKREDGKPLKGFGLEIETECQSIYNQVVYAEVLNKIIFPHFPKDLFKLQNDGSLGGRTSAECITQPMTKEFIRNNYTNFKLMYDKYFSAFQVDCARSGHCGMHVNLSNGLFGSDKKQEEAIKKLIYIVNKHFEKMALLFKRSPLLTEYCSKMVNCCNKELVKNIDLKNQLISHSVCINLGHFKVGRIELRLVGGQPTYAAFRNTMESVFFLVERVKNISWNDCDNFQKVFQGCNQYVCDRIRSDIYKKHLITDEEYNEIENGVIREELI